VGYFNYSRKNKRKIFPIGLRIRLRFNLCVQFFGASSGYPIGISVSSASKHEIPLVEETLDKIFTGKKPKVILADKAYDSDPLDAKLLKERKIRLVAPHRDNRTKKKTQDGRELRRYKRRYRIERCFAWLYNNKRLQTRNEKKFDNFTNFLLLGLTNILVKKLINSTS
jgi:transposase